MKGFMALMKLLLLFNLWAIQLIKLGFTSLFSITVASPITADIIFLWTLAKVFVPEAAAARSVHGYTQILSL